jgi:hypothetical protein
MTIEEQGKSLSFGFLQMRGKEMLWPLSFD